MTTEDGGRWSWANVRNQTPEAIKDWVVLTTGFVLGCFGFNPEMWQVTAGGGVLLVTLNIFYVRPRRKAADDDKVIQGMDLAQAVASRGRPLVAEDEQAAG